MLPILVLAAADAIVMDGDFNDWNGVTNTICVDAFDAAAGGARPRRRSGLGRYCGDLRLARRAELF